VSLLLTLRILAGLVMSLIGSFLTMLIVSYTFVSSFSGYVKQILILQFHSEFA